MVSPQKQIFKCFGCGAGGNAIKFYADIERMDRRDTVQHLAKDVGVEVKISDFTADKMQESAEEKQKLQRVNVLAQTYFREQFTQNAEIQSYVTEKRKLSEEIVAQF